MATERSATSKVKLIKLKKSRLFQTTARLYTAASAVRKQQRIQPMIDPDHDPESSNPYLSRRAF